MTCRIGDFGLSVDLSASGVAGEEDNTLYVGAGMNNKVPIRWTAIEVSSLCCAILNFRQYAFVNIPAPLMSGLLEFCYGKSGRMVTYVPESTNSVDAQMPYKGWPNKKVTEQVSLGYRLQKPSAVCPDSVYEIMIKCWNKNVKRRITFAKANQLLVDCWNEASREVCLCLLIHLM